MAIRKVGKSWKMEYRPKNGKPIYETFATKIEAKNRFDELQIQNDRSANSATCRFTFGEAIDKFIEEELPLRNKDDRWEKNRLLRFKREMDADAPFVAIDEHDIAQFIKKRKRQNVKNNTILRDLSLLRALFREAITWRWIEKSPFEKAKLPKANDGRERRISEEEIILICDALGYRENQNVQNGKQAMAVAFLLALETAMRQGEIFKLRWENIHLNQQYLQLITSKNGSARKIPLSDRAVELIKKLRGLHPEKMIPFNQGSCQSQFYKAVRNIKLHDFQFRDTRHEACFRLAKKVNVLELAKIIGHKNINQLLTYFNPTVQELAEKINKVDSYDGRKMTIEDLIEMATTLGITIIK